MRYTCKCLNFLVASLLLTCRDICIKSSWTYLSCEAGAAAIDANADSAGLACGEVYGGRLEVGDGADVPRFEAVAGEGGRTSTVGGVASGGNADLGDED